MDLVHTSLSAINRAIKGTQSPDQKTLATAQHLMLNQVEHFSACFTILFYYTC